MASQDVQDAKKETMKELNITDEKKVDYITDELLTAYAGAKDAKSPKRTSVNEIGDDVADSSYTDYGHNLVFQRGSVLYSNGPAGPNYKCGNQNRWSWRSDPGDEFTPMGGCTGSDQWYKLYCPTC